MIKESHVTDAEETKIKNEIEELKTTLTGNLLKDSETQQKIYELKKKIRPEIEDNPEEDDFEECLSCGS